MGNYSFSYAQRYALWRAYEMKCFYCERPLEFKNVTIDHVVPAYLEDDPVELQRIITQYEIEKSFPDFSINNYCNWVPSDGPGCNLKKGRILLPKNIILFYLSQVHKKIPKVIWELTKLSLSRKADRILGGLAIALEAGDISENDITNFLKDRELEFTKEDPLVITFGLTIENAIKNILLPEEVTITYFNLCDWLEEELVRNLRSLIPYSFYYTEPSGRNGETLSVRLVFPELNPDEKNKLNLNEIGQAMPWWEVLEVTNFYRIYREIYGRLET